MKTTITLVSILLLLGSFCPAIASPGDDKRLVAANNDFAFNLLKQIVKDEPASNIFISPYSASTVLQMVANGARGQTKAEMEQVLGTAVDTAANLASKDIAQSLKDVNSKVILEIANSIWYRQGTRVRPGFIDCNKEFFGATVTPVNFLDVQKATDIINAWAGENTHGRITHIADGMIDPLYTQMVLANAVYFKGKWSDPFDPNDTSDQPFNLRDGSQKTVRMMSKSKTFSYRRGSGYQAVRLPYEGESLSMDVFLPDTNSSPEKLLGIMSGDAWRRVTKPGFSDKDGDLRLPKFKLDYDVELPKPLKELGMKAAFDPDEADFLDIRPDDPGLHISAARQKTFVEVKEEGTEAAAVTEVGMNDAALPMTPLDRFKMIVDRPFIFLIEDNQTGTILFMGVIYNPPPD